MRNDRVPSDSEPRLGAGRGPKLGKHSRAAGSETFLSIRAVSKLLLVSDRTIRRWTENKNLKCHRFGRVMRIGSSDLVVLVERARRGGAPLRLRDPLEDTFYTAENIAEVLNVCIRTVRRRIESGALVAHDFHGIIRIAGSDLRDFIDRSVRD